MLNYTYLSPACQVFFMDVIQKPVKNFKKGRTSPIQRIIIHTIAGYPGNVYPHFNGGLKVSAHYMVRRDGDIEQYVNEQDTAWHTAGQNYNSIGIEHDDNNDWNNPETYTETLYESSAMLIAAINQRYQFGINSKRIEPHNKYANKACPGALDIAKLITMAKDFERKYKAYHDGAVKWESLAKGYRVDIINLQKQLSSAEKALANQVADTNVVVEQNGVLRASQLDLEGIIEDQQIEIVDLAKLIDELKLEIEKLRSGDTIEQPTNWFIKLLLKLFRR